VYGLPLCCLEPGTQRLPALAWNQANVCCSCRGWRHHGNNVDDATVELDSSPETLRGNAISPSDGGNAQRSWDDNSKPIRYGGLQEARSIAACWYSVA